MVHELLPNSIGTDGGRAEHVSCEALVCPSRNSAHRIHEL